MAYVVKAASACSHMTCGTASRPPSANTTKRAYCAYGTCCRYDHTKPPAAAGGAVGPAPHPSPSSRLHSPRPSPDIAISVMRTHSNEPGKRETTTLVLRDRNLTGLAEDKTPPSPVTNPGGCSDPQTSPEMKPHSYLDAIRTGLDDLEASSSYSNEQQLRPDGVRVWRCLCLPAWELG